MKNAENLFVALGVVIAIAIGMHIGTPYIINGDFLAADNINCSAPTGTFNCTQNTNLNTKCSGQFSTLDSSASTSNSYVDTRYQDTECLSAPCNVEGHFKILFDCTPAPYPRP